jgi:amino acid adenylation domain-containing protein
VASDLNNSTEFIAKFQPLNGAKPQPRYSRSNLVETDEWLLHGAFVNRARNFPQAIAVICGQDSLTYGDLLARAETLARHLRELGVRNGDLVGICTERSIDMLVGVYGILLAGGAYVPFDPSYPGERLQFMLDDAQVKYLCTQRPLAERFAASGAELILLDEPLPESAADDEPLPEIDPSQLCYIIFTSGSTGRPKGVMLQHRGVMNTIHEINRRFGLKSSDRVLNLSSICFDMSVYDFFGLLSLGGAVVIPTAAELREPGSWASLIERHRITFWNSVPAFMEMLVTYASGMQRARLDSLRLVFLAGDWIPVSLPDRIRALANDAEVVSLGGATEVSIYSNYYRIGKVDPNWKSIPYGVALDNQTMLVLDEQLQPCDVDVVGEIYFGGDGVALGYLHREELTAQRFLPDPFAPGGTLYRTGDLGRLMPDGNVEFLGRIDHQVKVNGFRIELGEIETALARLPQVAEAVAVARNAVSGGKYLTAYLSTTNGQPIDQEQLVAELRKTLPEYMIPSRIVWLEKLPLSANGKIDRGALPEPPRLKVSAEAMTELQTETERELAICWKKVLGEQQLGPESRFMQLGGDSLQAVQVLLAARCRWTVELGISNLLGPNATLAKMAAEIETQVRAGTTLVPLVADTSDLPVSMSLVQEQLWTLEQFRDSGAAYNIPLAVRLRGKLDVSALQASLNTVLERHAALRTVFTAITVGQVIQQILPMTQWLLRVVDLRTCPAVGRAERCAELLRDELRQRFDLARGPLARALLVKLGDEEHELLLTIHHIVADGWSLALLIDEINALYTTRVQQTAAELPVLTVQYTDYTRWQQQWLDSPAATAAAEYWQQQLGGEIAELALPTDRPRTPAFDSRGGICSFSLPPELAAKLKDLSRSQDVTMYVTLLAAWQSLLARLSGQNEILVGTPAACRSQPEVQNIIGCLINTLVMRTSFAGDPTISQLLSRVRTTAHEAFAHSELPFVELTRQLARAGHGGHSLYNVMFAWQNTPFAKFELPGLAAEIFEVETGSAKFDLLLTMQETPAGFTGNIEYRSAIFDRTTIEGFVKNLLAVLGDFTAVDLHTPVANLPSLAALVANKPVNAATVTARKTGDADTGTRRDDAPQIHQLERRLIAIWQECFELPRIGVRDNFFDLGGDSLLATALLARMEREFQQSFAIAILLERPTIQQLAEWLRSDRRVREFSSLVMLQPGSGRAPLFIIPGIHGSLWEFRKLAGKLDPALPIYGLEPRGLDSQCEPDQTIPAMADHYVEEIQRVQPTGPYHLAGYSLGGTVAYEMAQRLKTAGHEVALVAMIDAPTGGHSRPVRLIQSTINGTVSSIRAGYNVLARRAGWKRWENEDQLLNGLTPGREVIFNTHRQALDHYSPGPYTGEVTVLRATIRPSWPKCYFDDTSRQWLNYAPGRILQIPGCHFTLFDDAHIGGLAETLMKCLDESPAAKVKV